MNESASETYGVFCTVGDMKDDRVFTGTKVEADAFAADRNSKLDKTELDDQGIKYEVRKCTKPEGQKDVSKPGELPKMKEAALAAKDFKVGDRFVYKDPVLPGKATATVKRVDVDQNMMVAETDRGYLFTVKSHEGERGYVPGAARMLRSQILFSDILSNRMIPSQDNLQDKQSWKKTEESSLSEAFGPMAGPKEASTFRNQASYDGVMRTVRELRKDLQAGMLSPDEVFDALQQEGYGPAKAKELVNKWGEGIYDPLTEAFGPMAGPQVGSWPRRDADDGIKELSSENDFDNEDDDFEIIEGPIAEQDRVTVDPAYGGGRGTVTDVRGSYITVKLDDGDVEIYHLSDLTKISESVKTDRWNREAADAQRAEAEALSKEAELTIAARRVEELLDTGMGSIEAWDTVLEEFPGIDEDALASKL